MIIPELAAEKFVPNFHEIRDKFGGKAAGVTLIERLKRKKSSPIQSFIQPQVRIPCDVYGAFAKKMDGLLTRKRTTFKELYQEEKRNSFVNSVRPTFNLLLEEFSQRYGTKIASLKNNKLGYLLRSSTPNEDWIKDLTGAFDSTQFGIMRRNTFGEKLTKRGLQNHLFQIFSGHYTNQQNFPELSDEPLGLSISSFLGPGLEGANKYSIQVMSSVPELSTPITRIEVSENSVWGSPAIQLYEITDSDVKIFDCEETRLSVNLHEYAKDEYKQSSDLFSSQRPFEVNGQRSVLPMSTILQLYQEAKELENCLEGAVELEYISYQQDIYTDDYLVQIKPTPRYKTVEPLTPLPEGALELGTSPFVHGQYSLELPLTHPTYKYNKVLKEPQILFLDQWDRPSDDDGHIKGVFSTSAYALSHSASNMPTLPSTRAKFKYLGLPQLAPDNTPIKAPLLAQHLNGNRRSAVPMVMESNGRYGRLWIRQENVKTFLNAKYEPEPVQKPDLNEIPF